MIRPRYPGSASRQKVELNFSGSYQSREMTYTDSGSHLESSQAFYVGFGMILALATWPALNCTLRSFWKFDRFAEKFQSDQLSDSGIYFSVCEGEREREPQALDDSSMLRRRPEGRDT